MTKSVYEIITEKIIERLENGVVPWHKPWTNSNAVDWKTQKPYRGINNFFVVPGEYASKNQILEAGTHQKRGDEKFSYHCVLDLERKRR